MKKKLFSVTRKDLKIEYFRPSGPGGQKTNKTSSAVRISHPESGAVSISQDERKQNQNLKKAFERLVNTEKFKLWHRLKCIELLSSESIEDKVEKMMNLDNLKIEIRNRGEWEKEIK